jgi:hypothetical protein
MLFSALTLVLGLDPMSATRWSGLAAGVGLILLTVLYSRRIAGHVGPQVTIAAFLMVPASALAAESVQGLETVPFALIVLAALYRHAREVDPQNEARGIPWSGLLCGVAALTRPEGIGVFGLLLIHRLALAWRRGRRPGRQDLGFAALFLVLVVPHLVFRLAYYGHPLPNTFYAKVGATTGQVVRGLKYLGAFLAAAPLLFLASPVGAWTRWRHAWWWSLVLVVTGYIGEVVLVGGDFKPTFRFFIPVLAPLAILAAEGLTTFARQAGGVDSRRLASGVALAAILLSGYWLWAKTEINRLAAGNQRVTHEAMQIAGAYLARNHAGETVAIGTAGMIPYFSGLRTVDMWGLNDLHIARVHAMTAGEGDAGHERGDGAYVLSRRPDIVFFKFSTRSLRRIAREEVPAFGVWVGSEGQLLDLPEFERDYRFRSVPLAGFYLNYFERIAP